MLEKFKYKNKKDSNTQNRKKKEIGTSSKICLNRFQEMLGKKMLALHHTDNFLSFHRKRLGIPEDWLSERSSEENDRSLQQLFGSWDQHDASPSDNEN